MKRKIIDWRPIDAMAKIGGCNYRELSEKFSVCVSTVKGHCCKIGHPLGDRSTGRKQIHDWAQIDPLLKAIPVQSNVGKIRELHRQYKDIPWFSFIDRYYGVHRVRVNAGHPEAEARAPAKMLSRQLPASMETKRRVMGMDSERFAWWIAGTGGKQWLESMVSG